MNLYSHTIASAFYGIYSISGISARIRVSFFIEEKS